MLLLALDTATSHVGVAIGDAGEVRGEIRLAGGRRHAEQLAPAIRELTHWTGVRLEQLAAIAVDIGPGLFTGLRVGVTTAKVMAQALRIPVVPVASLDLVAYPLRHARRTIVAVLDARRREVFHASYVPVPGGVQRTTEYAVDSPVDLIADLEASGDEILLAGDGIAAHAVAFASLDRAELAGPELSAPSTAALVALATSRVEREEFVAPWDVQPCYLRASDAEQLGRGTGLRGRAVTMSPPLTVQVIAMRRRHLRAVLRIEEQVYPRPWSHSLFLSELALRGTRSYFVARVGREVVGYAGLLLSGEDGHVTTIAVDPVWQRHAIATRLMLALTHEAVARDACHLTLEVRLSNRGAQLLYQRFGFVPVGVRKNYYQETNEDALVMWVHEIDGPEHQDRLDRIERDLPGETVFEGRS